MFVCEIFLFLLFVLFLLFLLLLFDLLFLLNVILILNISESLSLKLIYFYLAIFLRRNITLINFIL